MLWLDSKYPVDSTAYGAQRGPCPTTSGVPSETRAAHPDSLVKYMNIKVGTIGSTTKFPPAPAPPSPTPPGPSPAPSSGQCCYGGCSGNCQGGWCGQSQAHCETTCNGNWCPTAAQVIV